MKIIPYIRFSWAAWMCVNLIRNTNADLQSLNGIALLPSILGGIVTVTFVAYCFVMGLQEIRNQQIIEARYFESFGAIFQFLIFIGGLYLIWTQLRQQADFWRIGLMTIWQIGLLGLLVVDIKRIRAS